MGRLPPRHSLARSVPTPPGPTSEELSPHQGPRCLVGDRLHVHLGLLQVHILCGAAGTAMAGRSGVQLREMRPGLTPGRDGLPEAWSLPTLSPASARTCEASLDLGRSHSLLPVPRWPLSPRDPQARLQGGARGKRLGPRLHEQFQCRGTGSHDSHRSPRPIPLRGALPPLSPTLQRQICSQESQSISIITLCVVVGFFFQ